MAFAVTENLKCCASGDIGNTQVSCPHKQQNGDPQTPGAPVGRGVSAGPTDSAAG